MSYTGGMSALKDGDGEEIGSHFPDNDDDTKFLVPEGFSLKIGLGLRI
jgi:hypothetical protein